MFRRRISNQDIGLWGEKQAERALKREGFKIVDRRVRVGQRDELDIVARDGEVLVFVEVKTRKNEEFGRPADAVDRGKRRVTSRAAIRYLRQLRKPDVLFRFDVVEVIGEMDDAAPDVRHIRNAFNLDRRYRYP
jgi:putative endonuclease